MNFQNKMLTSRLSKPVAFSAILTSLGTSSATAAITISQVAGFPLSPDISVITPAQSNVNDNVRVDSGRFLTQTFQVASGFTLGKVYIDVTNLAANKAFDVSIFAVSDTNLGAPNAIPTGINLLTTISVTTPVSISGAAGVLTFDFSGVDAIFLAATTGTAGYALQFNAVTDDSDPFVWVTHASGDGTSGGTVGPDLYTAGQAYGSVLGGGFTHGNSDFTLALVAVPEPSTSLLAIFASSSLLMRRRRA